MVQLFSSTTLFRFYLKFFQLLGQCPVVFSHSKNFNSTVLTAISLLHVMALTLATILVYVYQRHIIFNDDSFGKFNDTIKCIALMIAYYAIIFESFWKREAQSKIWNHLADFYQIDRLDKLDQCKLWSGKEFSCYFLGYCGILFLSDGYRTPFIWNTNQAINYWFVTTTLLIVSRSRHMQYIFYLNIVQRQLQLLFQELQMIGEYSKYNRTKLQNTAQDSYNRFLYHRLYLAREHYSLIYELSTQINETFGWSHLVNITHSFIQILTDIYWSYWNIDNETYVLSGG